ncbi:SDR family oxidoreductase [Desulfovibrio sp. JY]|nr:SDR family oxidoreductase [Desulfovibrio sp. JY]
MPYESPMKRPMLLAGKTAIVTGASSGIGRATALALAGEGASVVLAARRREELDALAAEIAKAGGKALAVAGDAGSVEGIEKLLAAALAWDESGGKYDIVVVNAGRGLAGSLLTSDESQWEALYKINVLGAAHLMRRAGTYLKERGTGDIVVVSSVVGRNISPVSGFYGSSKFAVSGMAEALRREICSAGVRVTTVMPGVVLSGFQKVAGYSDDFAKFAEKMGKLLEPEDLAEGIRWLLTLPQHVHVNEIMIRPTGAMYP